MADETIGRLTDLDISRLSAAISAPSMESIALGYLGLPIERVMSVKDVNRGNEFAFNRELIRNWSYRNSSSDEKLVSFV